MPVREQSRLIKASRVRQLGGSATHHFDDLRRQCDEHLAQTRRQAQSLLDAATRDADEIRRQAREAGWDEGRQAGLTAAHDLISARAGELAAEQTALRLETVLPAIGASVAGIERERDRWLAEWETAAVRLSAAMAERIVHRELSCHPEWTGELVRRALQLAAGSPQVRLRLHPDDLAQLRDIEPQLLETLSRVAEFTLMEDDGIARGGCLIETQHGVIDARIETQAARIIEELLGGAQG